MPARSRWQRFLRRWHYSFVGLVGAVAFFCLSLTPSLLPRGHVLQGLISGIPRRSGTGWACWRCGWSGSCPRARCPDPTRTAWRWLAARRRGRGRGVPVPGLRLAAGDPPADGHGRRRRGSASRSSWSWPRSWPPAWSAWSGCCAGGARGVAGLLGRWIPAATARVAGRPGRRRCWRSGCSTASCSTGSSPSTDSGFRTVNGETEPGRRSPRPIRCAPAGRARWCPGRRWATRAAPSSPAGRARRSCSASAARPARRRSGSTPGWTRRRRPGSGPPSRCGSCSAPARSPAGCSA